VIVGIESPARGHSSVQDDVGRAELPAYLSDFSSLGYIQWGFTLQATTARTEVPTDATLNDNASSGRNLTGCKSSH
jgi:hypothetical protein